MAVFSGHATRIPGSFHAKRRRIRLAVLLSGMTAVATIAAVVATIAGAGPFASMAQGSVSRSRIASAWKTGDYAAVFEISGEALALRPVDPFILAFRGFSAFYRSLALVEREQREPLLDEAVFSLRKAIAASRTLPVRGEIEYILGKAYYHKGPDYYDLAVESLGRSREFGHDAPDMHEYLGALHAGLGEYDKAVDSFEAALARGKSDLLAFSAAKANVEAGDLNRAEALLSELVDTGTDALVRENGMLLLAEILRTKKEYRAAEDRLLRIVEGNPESASAFHLLGLVYQDTGDAIRARAAWRKAVAVDPMHVASRQKLAERQ